MLDKLKAATRHAIIAAIPLVATAVLNLIPGLQKQYGADAGVALALTIAALWLTPLTKQYGVSSK